MTTFSMLTSLAESLGKLGVPSAPASDRAFTANAFGHERRTLPGATNKNPAGRILALSPGSGTARAGQCLPWSRALPEGYVPVREAKNLALLGRWPLLDDKLPACLPMKLYRAPADLLTSPMQNAQYQGRWAYHHSSRTLAFEFPAPVAGARGKCEDTWQIELLGCRRGALFGRDRRTVAYTLEYLAARGDAQQAKRVVAGRQP